MRRVGHLPLLALVGALAGLSSTPLRAAGQAAAPERPPPPGPDTGWHEVRTPHVVLQTDLGLEQARRAALAVERTRTALLSAAWRGAGLSQVEHIDVVVFANGLDFEHHFGKAVGGFFTHGAYPPLAVLYGTAEHWEHRQTLALTETTSVLKHELVHHLAAFFYRRQPRWFAEGLAQFLETLRISEDGKTAVVGAINLDALGRYNAHRTVGVADALAWGGKLDAEDEGTTSGLYGVSWLLVHWLFNVHPTEFAAFQTLLVKGIDPELAWKQTLGSLALDAVDRELHQYSRYGQYTESNAPLMDSPTVVEDRPMTSADVHATRARVALVAARSQVAGDALRAEASKELTLALADDPGHVRALRLQASLLPKADRLALARRATTSHPEDGLAWLSLGEALPDAGTEAELAYRKATALLPDNPVAFDHLAAVLLQQGKANEALPRALTATRISPWNPGFQDTLADALAAVGRCTEAVAAEARAVEGLAEGGSPKLLAELRQRLESYRKRCPTAAAPP